MPSVRTSRKIAGELALIEAIRRRAARSGGRGTVRLGIGDDCAVLRPKLNHEICVTTDFSLEGVHFRRDWHAPQSAGHRCLARGLSDLAAMGAEPMAVFLSLALPAKTSQAWVDGFLEGLLALADRYDVPLAGGDTAQAPGGIAVDIIAVGQVPRGKARLRSGARPGDRIYVTGALGGAAAELMTLGRSPSRFRCITKAAPNHPHLFPEPRLAVATRLRRLASAMIDVSDGLSTDLTHLAQESGLSTEIDAAALPLHPLAIDAEQRGRISSALEAALHGGEDYELLFAARPGVKIPRSIAGVPITPIGTFLRSKSPRITLRKGDSGLEIVSSRGWEHFLR